MSRGCLISIAALLLVVLGIGGCGVGKYNGIVTHHEAIDSKFTEITNQYQRRYDLIPNLVSTVKGVADFERETITAVTEARASVGKLQLPDDPAAAQQWIAAQESLGASLGRLLVVAENYPQLRASQNFLTLQDQLEGTENRIAVARRDYIESVRTYNTSIRRFPGNLIAGMSGLEKQDQLEFEAGIEKNPQVEFDFGEDG